MTRLYEHSETDNGVVLNCPTCKKLTVYIEKPMETATKVGSEFTITCRVCRECGGSVYWVPSVPARSDVYTVFRENK